MANRWTTPCIVESDVHTNDVTCVEGEGRCDSVRNRLPTSSMITLIQIDNEGMSDGNQARSCMSDVALERAWLVHCHWSVIMASMKTSCQWVVGGIFMLMQREHTHSVVHPMFVVLAAESVDDSTGIGLMPSFIDGGGGELSSASNPKPSGAGVAVCVDPAPARSVVAWQPTSTDSNVSIISTQTVTVTRLVRPTHTVSLRSYSQRFMPTKTPLVLNAWG